MISSRYLLGKDLFELADKSGKHAGSTVQIKIPVVATVIQQSESGGHMSMAVVSPGPNGELVNQSGLSSAHSDSFVYSSTLTGNESIESK